MNGTQGSTAETGGHGRPSRRWDDRPGAVPALTFARFLTTGPTAAEALRFLVGLLSWPIGTCEAWLICPRPDGHAVCVTYGESIDTEMGSSRPTVDLEDRLASAAAAAAAGRPALWTKPARAEEAALAAWPLGLGEGPIRVLVLRLATPVDPEIVAERAIGVPEALAVYLSGSTAFLGLPALCPVTDAEEVHLTERQHQVLALLADGLTLHQIGGRIGFSESTARSESLAIYRELGVHDREAAVDVAQRLGLL